MRKLRAFHLQRKYLYTQLTSYGLRPLHVVKIRNSISHVSVADIEPGKEAPVIREAAISRQ